MTAGARMERVVRGVCANAVNEASAAGIVVLEDWTPEGELLYEWLVRELGEGRVWRAASLASNLQAGGGADGGLAAAWRAARDDGALVAHPANRTALLLGGRLPWADLLPFGDIPASQVEALTGRWSGPPDVEALAGAAGGIGPLDAALERLVDRREPADTALAGLDGAVTEHVLRNYDRGRPFRLRARLVPKLGARTIGIDLFD